MTPARRKPHQQDLFPENEALSARESEKWLRRLGRELAVSASAKGVAEVRMLRGIEKPHAAEAEPQGSALAEKTAREIHEYLKGERKRFTARADLSALTPFMRRSLLACAKIPYGETRSYGWVAAQAGNPQAARAVGQAMNKNPVPLLVP